MRAASVSGADRRRLWAFRLAAVALAFGGCLALLEGALRAHAAFSPPKPKTNVWAYSPTRHHLLTPGASTRHSSPEFDYWWQNNSLGMRDRERTRQKQPGVFRILFLGDSMVQGHGVTLEDTIPAQLEQRIAAAAPGRRIEVLNAGVFGYSPMLEWLYLLEIVDDLTPDLLVLGLTLANDVGDDDFYARTAQWDSSGRPMFANARWPWWKIGVALGGEGEGSRTVGEQRNATSIRVAMTDPAQLLRSLRTYKVARQAYRSVVPDFDSYSTQHRRARALVASHQADITYNLGLVNYPVLSKEARLGYWETTKRYLREIRDLCQARSLALVIVVIPTLERLNGTTNFDEPYEVTGAIGAELEIPVVQLLPSFHAHDASRLFYPYDRHLAPGGTRLAAGVIAEALPRLGMLEMR